MINLALNFRRRFRKIICVAHNGSGFHSQFILKFLVEELGERVKPSIIMNGSKIILMEYLNLKFIDSLNYFHMPLAALPKAFGFSEESKGYFCHLFNTPENQSYVGQIPRLDMYSRDLMNAKERETFLKCFKMVQQKFVRRLCI